MKSEQSELPAVIPKQPLAVAPVGQAPDVAVMLHAVIEKGVTAENVNAVKEIVGLYERMQDRDAVKSFARAFNALQDEMPKVQAQKMVKNRDGTPRYTFAPYEDIMEQARPFLLKHGFTVSFSTRYDEGRLVKICSLTHVDGHSKSNEFAVRIGSGPPGSSETQADGAAGTYAKRFALCDALNIVIEKDSDAKLEGNTATITKEQADELEHRVAMTNGSKEAFLKMAGVKTFAEIPADNYTILDNLLRKKEQAGK